MKTKRFEKYPETSTFHYYNANYKNKIAADCVIRAICTALGQTWEQTVRELTEIGIKNGLVLNEKACYEKYLAMKGWVKHKQPRKWDNTKYTGKEFCEELQRIKPADEKKMIAHMGGHHIVAIINYKVYDHWNSTGGCVGNYWVKENG